MAPDFLVVTVYVLLTVPPTNWLVTSLPLSKANVNNGSDGSIVIVWLLPSTTRMVPVLGLVVALILEIGTGQ